MIVLRVLAVVTGLSTVAVVIGAAIRTVVVPRGEQLLLNLAVFRVLRFMFVGVANRRSSWVAKDRVLARFAPFSLMTLPVVWSVGIIGGFTLAFWGLDADRSLRAAFLLSGSSLTTLGIRDADDLASLVLVVFEALIGLGLVALLISFLPTMYSAFSTREKAVLKLFTRVNDQSGKPDHATMFVRWWTVGAFNRLQELWIEWENWFVEVEETHTSFSALVFFRSPSPDHSWVTAAGLALDQAAIYLSTIRAETSPEAALMVRTGFLSLRRIASFHGISFDPDPSPGDPISVTRAEFLAVYETLAENGLPVTPDREQAWRDFRGWRVNYDEVLVQLAELVIAPSAPWSSDREPRLDFKKVLRAQARSAISRK